MPISHKIRQYRALLGFVHPGKVPGYTEQGRRSLAQAGNMGGFVHQILVGSLRGG